MIGDPRDAWTYRIAVGALGLALLVALAGLTVVLAIGGSGANTSTSTTTIALSTQVALGMETASKTKLVSTGQTGLDVIGGTLAGALLGLLIPFAWPEGTKNEPDTKKGKASPATREQAGAGGAQGRGSRWGLWWAPLLILGVFALILGVLVLAVNKLELPYEVLAGVAVGALLGLLVPSPAVRP